ncbi:hypothetical protein [Shewanella sp. KCT]|uniref:hypothetical protein n=1 Tax=Shewanella sp. KCT TaxID=2569535 RepID=UPI0011828588|nr:hypothetical protein [Shewanella sp. KCT]TVP11440.1 hypothetical protein AYI87_15970 [Shewanella sp. KCT]
MKPQSGQGWRTACHRRICTTLAGQALDSHEGVTFKSIANTQAAKRYDLKAFPHSLAGQALDNHEGVTFKSIANTQAAKRYDPKAFPHSPAGQALTCHEGRLFKHIQ